MDDLAALKTKADAATEAYHDAKIQLSRAQDDWVKATNAYGLALMRSNAAARAEEARA